MIEPLVQSPFKKKEYDVVKRLTVTFLIYRTLLSSLIYIFLATVLHLAL